MGGSGVRRGCICFHFSSLTLSKGKFSASTPKTNVLGVRKMEDVLFQAILGAVTGTQAMGSLAMVAIGTSIAFRLRMGA